MNSDRSFSAPKAVGQQYPHQATTLANDGSAVVKGSIDDLCGIQPTTMSDEERAQAEHRAGVAMVVWHDRYEKTGDPACWRIAFRHMQQMWAIRAMGRANG